MIDSEREGADEASHGSDHERVAELLGRRPQGDYEVVVRRNDGWPVILRNEPLLHSGRPMPTRYWLIDPLDGTKEFINRNGEYTVNIALIDNHQPVLGIVYVPVKKVFYYGVKGQGSWKKSSAGVTLIAARKVSEGGQVKVVASRRHGAEEVEKMISEAEKAFGCVEKVSMGSSLKICMLADGTADWYPRLALTSEWDTAAAQAVLEAAGGVIYDDEFNRLECNRKDSMLNPFFHAVADGNYDWKGLVERALAS